MRPAQVETSLVIIGTLGTIVFGVWLAISLDAYKVWDGWVIAAIVLWAGRHEVGRRAGAAYAEAGKRAEELSASGRHVQPRIAATFGKSKALWFHLAGIVLSS